MHEGIFMEGESGGGGMLVDFYSISLSNGECYYNNKTIVFFFS